MPALTKVPAPGKLRVLRVPAWQDIPWLVHGFSGRSGGFSRCYGGRSLNLGLTREDDPENVERNRDRLLAAVGTAHDGQPWPLITLRQMHSDLIQVINSPAAAAGRMANSKGVSPRTMNPRAAPPGPLMGDGLVTDLPRIALAIQTADCFPVLLADTRNHAVGGFHAGWRGTAKRIIEKGLGVMRYEYGSRPQDIHAVLGPGIQKCCYAVGEELKSQFDAQFAYADELFHEVGSAAPVREKYPLLFMNARAPGHGDMGPQLHLDLAEANRRQLLLAGVPQEQITVIPDCTACNPKDFFSHRADVGRTGRMMAVIGISQ